MKSELIFSGIGGQGTILMGKMACTAAAKKGYNVTLSPAYGQEKRGGRASCQVVISEEMGSMMISAADTKATRTDIKVVEIPFTEIATEVATPKSANMVALGAVVKTLDIITLDDARAVIKMKMKPALVEANIKALEAGYDYVK